METLEEKIKALGLPDPNEIEITTIGVGRYEGESLVVHLGNNEWAIIDSCKADDGTILPLFYLKELGVTYDHVKVIVCTHWHTDHIKGLSVVVRECDQADFFYPAVGQGNNQLKLLIEGDKAQGRSSVWKEFIACYHNAGNRGDYAHHDKVLYDNGHGSQLLALSPSKKMLDIVFEKLIGVDGNNRDVRQINESILEPNICSIAIVLNTPDTNVLLGGDLEAFRGKRKPILSCVGTCKQRWDRGWCNVIEKSKVLYDKSISLFKLPHHASKTGYCQTVWNNKTQENVTTVSTVFVNNKGIKLPQKNMLHTYYNLSSEMYLTSPGPSKRDKKSGKSLLDQNRLPQISTIAVFNEEKGFVCSRKKSGGFWTTQILGTAIKVSDGFLKNYDKVKKVKSKK